MEDTARTVRRDLPLDGRPADVGPAPAAPGAPTAAPATPNIEGASRSWLLPQLMIVLVMVGLLAYEYSRAPIPPGVDPGHWLSTAYAYVGLPTAPDPANQPLFYSPLIFPILGGLVVLTGNPPLAASVFGVLLLLGYGLTVVHLARRYLRSGVMQVALVGLAMTCGTTLQMLFWGAYPNYLGFIGLNETLVFLLLFVREHRTVDAFGLYAWAGFTYFAHDLTFFVLAAVVGLAAVFLLIFRRLPWRFLVDRRNLAGVVGLAAIIEGYGYLTARLGISHPSYFFSNAAAYVVDNIGEIFLPLAHAPAFAPAGAGVLLSPHAAVALLLAAPLLALAVLALVQWGRPDRLNSRTIVAAAWLGAACAVPALGYLAHIETDYTRFLYYLPLPFALLTVLALESGFAPYLGLSGAPSSALPPSGAGPVDAAWTPSLARPQAPPSRWVGNAVVAAVVLVLFFTVSLPTAQAGETSGTSIAHDTEFLAAMHWLKAEPGAGNVLTVSSAARWCEALSDRQALTVGPIWLLFDPFQIVNAEETYWALSSSETLTDSSVALSYSGFNTSVFSQAPLYNAYVDGIPFPVLRVLPGALVLNASGASGAHTYAAMGGGTPAVSFPGPSGTDAVVVYSSAAATIAEEAAPTGGGGAEITFTITPRSGVTVNSIGLTLAGTPAGATVITRAIATNLSYAAGTLAWTVQGPLGQAPEPAIMTTNVAFTEPASADAVGVFDGAPDWTGTFPVHSARPFVLTLALATAGTSNPTSALPEAFSTAAFLAAHDVRYLVWPAGAYFGSEVAYYEAAFGFHAGFANAEWVVLAR